MKKQVLVLAGAMMALAAVAGDDNVPQDGIIQVTSGAYFNLGIEGTGARTYEAVIQKTGYSSAWDDGGTLLGTWAANGRRCQVFAFRHNGAVTQAWGMFDESYAYDYYLGTGTFKVLKAEMCGMRDDTGKFIGRAKLFCDGVEVGSHDFAKGEDMTVNSAGTLYLFARNNATGSADTAESFFDYCYFGRLTVWEGTETDGNFNPTPIRNYVPAKDANGTVCLYETVEKKYYYNQDPSKPITWLVGRGDYGEGRASMTSATTSVTASNLKVKPRYPWSGLVDLSYDIAFADRGPTAFVHFAATYTDATSGETKSIAMKTFTDGSTEPRLVSTNGTYRITWNAAVDAPELMVENIQFSVTANMAPYRVLDLETGATTYLEEVPDGGWTDEYKTTKMVFRLVQPQRYRKGWNVWLRDAYSEQWPGYYEITKPYYLAIFELTQGQAKIINGGTYVGEGFTGVNRDKRPVSNISHIAMRGTRPTIDWPTTGSAVAADSFIGKMRAKYGSDFYDLPTEAEWECAARCGTDGFYTSGDTYGTSARDYSPKDAQEERHGVSVNANSLLDTCGRYKYNGGYIDNGDGTWTAPVRGSDTTNGTAVVGSYLPNAWGFYDMVGNVGELVLDQWVGGTRAFGWYVDYVGPSTSPETKSRVYRGGSWENGTTWANNAYVGQYWTEKDNNNAIGARLCWRFPKPGTDD